MLHLRHCVRSCLNGWAQNVAMNGGTSIWQLLTGGIPQGSVLRPVQFNILICDLDKRIECTLIKFTEMTLLCRSVDLLEGEGQKGFAGGSRQANVLRFNKEEFLVLHRTTSCGTTGLGKCGWKAAQQRRT